MIERHAAPAQMLARSALGIGLERSPWGKLPLIEAIGAQLADLHRNARRPVLVVNEAQPASSSLLTQALSGDAMRSLHQVDAELVRDVADDQE